MSDKLRSILDKINYCRDYDSSNRIEMKNDHLFYSGEQYDADTLKARNGEGYRRPTLVMNRLPSMANKVINDARQNRTQVKLSAVEDNDVDIREVVEGMVKAIEIDSSADYAYDTAIQNSVIGGLGFIKVVTEYEPKSFNQVIKIEPVQNVFAYYIDPDHEMPDGSDANYAACVVQVKYSDFEKMYPEATFGGDVMTKEYSGWDNRYEKVIYVFEYYEREYKDDEWILTLDGDEMLLSEYKKAKMNTTIVRRRNVEVPVIKWYKSTIHEILEEEDFPGIYIPIVPVYGNVYYIEGKRYYKGLVRDAKDAQKMYNYYTSTEAELLSQAPKAPIIAAAGQIEGYERIYETANQVPYSVLPYNPIDVNGTLLPQPSRLPMDGVPMGVVNGKTGAAEDLKAITGITDQVLGFKGNETSGYAILERKKQGELSYYHYIDNLNRAVRHVGRIIVNMIPIVYDTERMIRIVGEDGAQRLVKINEEGGIDLKNIKYDVAIDAGPSYATRRAESAKSMMEFAHQVPEKAALIADYIAKAMDWPDADKVAARLKRSLPPELMGEDEIDAGVLAQQLQQAQQQMAMLQEQNQYLTMQVQSGQAKNETAIQKEIIKSQTDIQTQAMKNASDLEQSRIAASGNIISNVLEEVSVLGSQIQELKQIIRMSLQPLNRDAATGRVPGSSTERSLNE